MSLSHSCTDHPSPLFSLIDGQYRNLRQEVFAFLEPNDFHALYSSRVHSLSKGVKDFLVTYEKDRRIYNHDDPALRLHFCAAIFSLYKEQMNSCRTRSYSSLPAKGLHFAVLRAKISFYMNRLKPSIQNLSLNQKVELKITQMLYALSNHSIHPNKFALMSDKQAYRNYALALAVLGGNAEALKAWVPQEFDLRKEPKIGSKLLFYACLQRNFSIGDFLLHHGADINHTVNEYMTLQDCAFLSKDDQLAAWILLRGADPNRYDLFGHTMLHLACKEEGCENIARLYIQNGANVNAADFRGMTPLHFACQAASKECVDLLLSHGAARDVRDFKQKKPNDYLPKTERGQQVRALYFS